MLSWAYFKVISQPFCRRGKENYDMPQNSRYTDRDSNPRRLDYGDYRIVTSDSSTHNWEQCVAVYLRAELGESNVLCETTLEPKLWVACHSLPATLCLNNQ
jgi:hypothetical protein